MQLLRSFLALTLALLLTGCGQPLPPDKSNYAGEWNGEAFRIRIASNGRVNYSRAKNGSTTKVDGPIQKFEGNDFYVGIAFITTKFTVSKPPTQVDGKWTMTIDGVEVTRR